MRSEGPRPPARPPPRASPLDPNQRVSAGGSIENGGSSRNEKGVMILFDQKQTRALDPKSLHPETIMPDVQPNVSLETIQLGEHEGVLPSRFNEFVVACEYLRNAGILDTIEQEFRLQRGGYQFIDAVLAGLAFFSAQPVYSGLRGLLDEVSLRGWSEPLAGIAGREKICSQPSMSRVLNDIPQQMALDFGARLLTTWSPAGQLADNEALLWRDCQGHPWHGFAIDGRVQPLRRRGLCGGEEYPDPSRLVDNLGAKPGYSGRKRADVQMETSILQHLGSSLYLAMNYAPGNGELVQDFEHGLAQIESWAKVRGIDPRQCFLAIDGEGGGFAQLRAGLASPVRFLTRLTHYQPLKDPGFRARLAEQTWQAVGDSQSGPRRWATEMGDYHLGQGAARLVVSCFEPAGGEKSGAGCFVDGLQYEVYACDFDRKSFPASEVVTTYYARAGRQENGFAQQDRHMDLEHLYSDSRPGQTVMMALGMWLHNFRAIKGAELFGELEAPKLTPQPRQVESVGALPFSSESSTANHESCPGSTSKTISLEASDQWWQMVAQKVEERIEGLDGFTYDPARRRIGCAKGVYLELSGVRQPDQNVVLRYRIGSRFHCLGCPFRDGCTSSESSAYRKEIEISMPPPASPAAIDDHDCTSDGDEAVDDSKATDVTDDAQLPKVCLGLRPARPAHYPTVGDSKMREPVLVASAFRNAFRQAARGIMVEVEVSSPPPTCTAVEYLARTAARRQRRRKTWDERLQWNGLPEQATVNINLKVPPDAIRLLHRPHISDPAPPIPRKAKG